MKNGSETNTRDEGLSYTQEEIEKMPKLKDGRFRITPDGYYQVRYRRGGYDIQFTSKNLKVVKEKFRAWVQSVNEAEKKACKAKPKKPQDVAFGDFAERYFAAVKCANVEAGTCKSQHRSMELHILPFLADKPLQQISPLDCQEVLNALLQEGKSRTAESIKFIMGEIFRAAIGEKIIKDNPMDFVRIPRHERETGEAIPLPEIRRFVVACERSPYRKQYMLYLWTGIRRNELHSVSIEGNFVVLACGKKRKGQRQKYRKIPIAPALRQFLPLSEAELSVDNDVLSKNFYKLCPGYTLNDLRHTFTTRAQECGISKTLVDVWTGHNNKRDMTASVYTHFSEEYQLMEIQKLYF